MCWFRRRADLLNVYAILGAFGLHFFFLAPLLHVAQDYWLNHVDEPDDWRTWLGAMGTVNLVGLFIYRKSRRSFEQFGLRWGRSSVWEIDGRRFWTVLMLLLPFTAALQYWVYDAWDGISGYVAAYETQDHESAFAGYGWLFLISESCPILAVFAWAYFNQRCQVRRSLLMFILVLVAFLVARMLFGGLRGSRSNTIFALFWAVGVLHYWVRPVSRKMLAVGAAFVLLFMYVYGFYKGAGIEGVIAISEARQRADLEESIGRNWTTTLLLDLGRADVQAFLLHQYLVVGEYQPAFGRTYVGAVSQLIPASIWPDRPATKLKEGSEIQFRQRMSQRSEFDRGSASSRIYGLAGETLLNFGPWAIPIAFVAWSWMAGFARGLQCSLAPQDARWLFMPFIILLCFLVLVNDSDNLVFFLVKNGAIPLVVLLVSCRFKRQMPRQHIANSAIVHLQARRRTSCYASISPRY